MNHLNHARTFATPLFAAALLLAGAGGALAATIHYVDVNSTYATPPFTNWTTAATNIQDAVDAAVAGDEIVVTNGIYCSVGVGKPMSIRSINGPQSTIIVYNCIVYFNTAPQEPNYDSSSTLNYSCR